MNNFNITKLPEFDGHEAVHFFSNKKTGLRCFISIHNRNRGPALGATRFWHYQFEEDALRDSLRLSRAMTYKCALAGIRYGGGKGVIIADKKKTKTSSLICAYAKAVDSLGGIFRTGEDVGMNNRDVRIMAEETQFVIGKIPKRSDNPAYWAALGTLYSSQTALKAVFGSSDVAGRTYAIKGLGKLGLELAKLIVDLGGEVIGADLEKGVIAKAKKQVPSIKIVSPSVIHKQKVDVYSPCAMGREFNDKTIKELRCQIICGGANNQLSSREDGVNLCKMDILYIPDYLANAGGLINVAAELRPEGYDRKWVVNKCKAIAKTTEMIIKKANRHHKPTSEVADQLAEKIFKKKGSN